MTSSRSNLENLARAKQLNAEAPSAEQIGRLLASAEAQLRDSRNASEYEGAPPTSAVEAEDLIRLTTDLQRLVLGRVRKGG